MCVCLFFFPTRFSEELTHVFDRVWSLVFDKKRKLVSNSCLEVINKTKNLIKFLVINKLRMWEHATDSSSKKANFYQFSWHSQIIYANLSCFYLIFVIAIRNVWTFYLLDDSSKTGILYLGPQVVFLTHFVLFLFLKHSFSCKHLNKKKMLLVSNNFR